MHVASMGGMDVVAEKAWKSKGPDHFDLVKGTKQGKRIYPAYNLDDFLQVMPRYMKQGAVNWQLHLAAGPGGWAVGYTNGKVFLGGHWGSHNVLVEAMAIYWAYCMKQGFFSRIIRVNA